MTTSVTNISRTNLNLLDPNLATNQIADPALRKNCFDEIYNYFDTFVAAYNAFIAAGGIATANLADLSVTSAKIALLAVTAAQLADSSVTSAKIVDGTIATGDIADGAITSAKITDGTIMNVDINASATIDATKIGAGTVSNTEFGYLDGVTGPIQTQLTNATLGAIADGSITDVKLDNGGTSIKARFTTHLADYIDHVPYAAAGGLVNAYTVTLSPALAAYTAGVALSVNINITNTGASTINVNGLGAKSILTSKGVAMTAGKLTAAGIYTLRYDGTNFILQGEGGSGDATASDLLSGKKASVDAGDIVGTMVNQPAYVNPVNYGPFGTSGLLLQRIPFGAYLTPNGGGYPEVQITDANFIAANIPNGMSMFGLTGTGANVKRWAKITGLTSSSTGIVTISGLAFTPTLFYGYYSNLSGVSLAIVGNKAADIQTGVGMNDAAGFYYNGSVYNGALANYPTWNASGFTLPLSNPSLANTTHLTFFVFE